MSERGNEAVAAAEETASGNGSGDRVPGVGGIIAFPGLAMFRRTPVQAVLLLVGGVLGPLGALIVVMSYRNDPVSLAARSGLTRGLLLIALAGILCRLAAVWLTSWTVTNTARRHRMQIVGSTLVGALMIPMALATVRVRQTNTVIETVFASNEDHGQITVQGDELGPQYETVLLLGGDEGEGRFGLRTDTMILVTIHRATGRAALISIPRNLEDLQFPPGSAMSERYPDGFDDLTNAVYITVTDDPELNAAYSGFGMEPGVRALMEGISYSMGITIDDYALINMCGFVSIVDALGGVTIDIDKQLPMPGRIECSNYRLEATIGPGVTFMDGTKALGYVRSRAADSDYQRMERQRLLLDAIGKAIDFNDIILRFGDLSAALRQNLRTSMTVQEAQAMLGLIAGSSEDLTSVGLIPPVAEPSDPDFADINRVLDRTRLDLASADES